MNEHKASRTLVKSPPELWAECSEATSLTKHLDQFGEIKITRLEPETAVAWEGERVSGTVRLEPSGWGTRVTLTAVAVGEPAVAAKPVAVEEPVAVAEPVVAEEPLVAEEPVVVEERVAVEEPAAVEAPIPSPTVTAKRPPRRGLFGRLFEFLGPRPVVEAPPAVSTPAVAATPLAATTPPASTPAARAVAPPTPAIQAVLEPSEPPRRSSEPPARPPDLPPRAPEPPARGPQPIAAELANAETALTAALDSLGQAHHRPFSRS